MTERFDLAAMEIAGGLLPTPGTDEREAFDAEHRRIVAGLLKVASPLPPHIFPPSDPRHRYPEHCPCQSCDNARQAQTNGAPNVARTG